MVAIATLVVAALIGLFGDVIRGCVLLSFLLAIVIAIVVELIACLMWEEKLILGSVVGLAALGVGIYYLRKYQRKQRREEWEITRYGDILRDDQRDDIAQEGERAWLRNEIEGCFCKVYTDYDRQRIKEVEQHIWRLEENEKIIRMGKEAWVEDQWRQLDEALEKRDKNERIVFDIWLPRFEREEILDKVRAEKKCKQKKKLFPQAES